MMDRNEIDARLQKLRADVPEHAGKNGGTKRISGQCSPGRGICWQGAAASAEEGRYVRHQLNRILQQAGVSVRM